MYSGDSQQPRLAVVFHILTNRGEACLWVPRNDNFPKIIYLQLCLCLFWALCSVIPISLKVVVN